MKYFLIIGGILLSVLNEIFEKENKESADSQIIIKKLTKQGKFVLILGVMLALLGLYQTWYEEKDNLKIGREKFEKDSTTLSNKNKSDSIRFMAIIKELNFTQEKVINTSNQIVSTTLSESQKILNSSENGKFPIPNTIGVRFDADFIVDESIIKKCDPIFIETYRKNHLGDTEKIPENAGISLNSLSFKDTSNLFLYHIFNLADSDISLGLMFMNEKGKRLMNINYKKSGPLVNWATFKGNPKSFPTFENDKYDVSYYFKEQKFKLSAFELNLDVNRTSDAKSLFDLMNSTIHAHLFVASYSHLLRKQYFFKLKLNKIDLMANNGLILHLNNFKFKEKENYFEQKLSNLERWQ